MIKEILICLCLVALVQTRHLPSKQDSPVAYSSIYTSFGSHIDIKEHTPIKEAETKAPIADDKTNKPTPAPKPTTSAPGPKSTSAPKPVPTSVPVQALTPPSEPAPVHEEVNEQKNNSKTTATDDMEEASVPPTTPTKSVPKVSLSVPLKDPIRGMDRLITPGLSDFASSGEEVEKATAKITVIESLTTEASKGKKSKSSGTSESSKASKNAKSDKTSKSETHKESNTSEESSGSDTGSHESFDGFDWD